jgi:hypothetical protein
VTRFWKSTSVKGCGLVFSVALREGIRVPD